MELEQKEPSVIELYKYESVLKKTLKRQACDNKQ